MEDADVPRRGGVNRFGPFTGGSAMNTFYRLISSAIRNYRSISQLRTIKTLTATEHMLHRRRDDISIPKFNGSLSSSGSTSITELNKTHFEEELSRLIKKLGLQTFFYVLSPDQTEMIYLPDNAHKVTIASVIEEHESRMMDPELMLFLSQLEIKATNCGWNNGYPQEDIIHLPLDPARTNITRNLLQEHAQFNINSLTQWAQANLINTQDKRAHNNYNMITCMKNSLTSDLQDTMDTEFESYTLGRTEVAALFLLALIKHAEPGTHATVALVRADLTRLDEKMLELDSNIQAFNEYVRKQKRKLTNRREQISDLLINLFKGYSAARDEKFALTISNIEEDYLHGKLPTLTDEILMSDAYKAYKVRVEKGIWGALGEDKETIIAMQVEIAELKDKHLKLDTKSGTKKKKKVTSPKK